MVVGFRVVGVREVSEKSFNIKLGCVYYVVGDVVEKGFFIV